MKYQSAELSSFIGPCTFCIVPCFASGCLRLGPAAAWMSPGRLTSTCILLPFWYWLVSLCSLSTRFLQNSRPLGIQILFLYAECHSLVFQQSSYHLRSSKTCLLIRLASKRTGLLRITRLSKHHTVVTFHKVQCLLKFQRAKCIRLRVFSSSLLPLARCWWMLIGQDRTTLLMRHIGLWLVLESCTLRPINRKLHLKHKFSGIFLGSWWFWSIRTLLKIRWKACRLHRLPWWWFGQIRWWILRAPEWRCPNHRFRGFWKERWFWEVFWEVIEFEGIWRGPWERNLIFCWRFQSIQRWLLACCFSYGFFSWVHAFWWRVLNYLLSFRRRRSITPVIFDLNRKKNTHLDGCPVINPGEDVGGFLIGDFLEHGLNEGSDILSQILFNFFLSIFHGTWYNL